VDDVLQTLEFVDHHCHGVTSLNGGVPAFEQRLTESREPMPFNQRYADTSLGHALLAICAGVLDFLEKPRMEDYVERRQELGEAEVARRFLSAAGLSAMVVDTGFACEETSPADLGTLAGCPSYVVHRVETIAEEILLRGGDRFVQDLSVELTSAAASGVGFKSILAYRGGLEQLTGRPAEAEIERACSQLADGRLGLADPVLIRHVLYETLEVASQRGLPIQFHVGYGDSDLLLSSANPLHLEGFIREAMDRDVPIVLLHSYPFHREAGILASVYPNVFFDIGLAIPHVGFEGQRILAEALEVAPFAKLLYSSDAAHLPEFFYLASRLFRRAAGAVFGRWVAEKWLSQADARRVLEMIGSTNARRVYAGMGSA
jgi:predicted TIM-barrel fold metal-dependent hydrolase